MPIPFHPYRHDDSTRSVREHIKTLKYIIKNTIKIFSNSALQIIWNVFDE